MAHYAIVNTNKKIIINEKEAFLVESVIVVDDKKEIVNGVASEINGQKWVSDFLNLPEHKSAIKTSYNSKIRKNFASIGMYYCPQIDCFFNPKPEVFPTDSFNKTIVGVWQLNEITCKWDYILQ